MKRTLLAGVVLASLMGCGSSTQSDVLNPDGSRIQAYVYGANTNSQIESFLIRGNDGGIETISNNAFSDGSPILGVEAPRNGRFLHLLRNSAIQTLNIDVPTGQLSSRSTIPATTGILGQELVSNVVGTLLANPAGATVRQYGVNADGTLAELLPAATLPGGSSAIDGVFDLTSSFGYFIQANGAIHRCQVLSSGELVYLDTTFPAGGPFDLEDCVIADNNSLLYVLDDQDAVDRILVFTINSNGTLSQRSSVNLPLGNYQNLTATGPFLATTDLDNGTILPFTIADNGDLSLSGTNTNLGGLGLTYVPRTPYLIGGANIANTNRLGSSQVTSQGGVVLSGAPNTVNTAGTIFDLSAVGYLLQ